MSLLTAHHKDNNMRLSKLLNATNITTVFINDEPVDVKYRVNLITDETTAHATERDDDAFLRKVLSDTIIEWDLTDENDQPVPCTDDILKTIDMRILSGIWIALLEASVPNVRTGNT